MEIVNIVVRNAVPIVGLVFFHWSAANLLSLYFIDTLLAIAVIAAGFFYHQFPAEEAPGLAARINTIAGYAGGAAFIALLFAVPLGMPIFILVFGVNQVSFLDMLRDHGFLVGVGLQTIASLVSFRDLVAALRKYSPDQLALKRRFAFVFLRWFGTMMAAFVPVTFLLGRYGPLLLVVVYIALTIYAELLPDRFLAAFGELETMGSAGGTQPRPRNDTRNGATSRHASPAGHDRSRRRTHRR